MQCYKIQSPSFVDSSSFVSILSHNTASPFYGGSSSILDDMTHESKAERSNEEVAQKDEASSSSIVTPLTQEPYVAPLATDHITNPSYGFQIADVQSQFIQAIALFLTMTGQHVSSDNHCGF